MHTFRAVRRQWVINVSLVVILFGILVAGLVWVMRGLLPLATLPMVLLLLVEVVREDILPLGRSNLTVAEDSLSQQGREATVVIALADIAAAKLGRTAAGPWRKLCLVLPDRERELSLQYLDHERIQQVLQERLGPQRWGEAAYARALEGQPARQKALRADAKLVSEVSGVLRICTPRWMAAIGVGTVLFFAAAMVLTLGSGSRAASLCFLPFLALGALVALPERLEIDARGVKRTVPLFGTYRLGWDELRSIEHGTGYDWLVLDGDDKRLTMMGPTFWGGAQGDTAWKYFQAQVRHRGIDMRSTWLASLKVLCKNTRED